MLTGDTFDDSFKAAKEYANIHGSIFCHAFEDLEIIDGQGTVAVEVLEDIEEQKIDHLVFPIGGGGLGAGVCSYFKIMSPQTKLIGCEPEGYIYHIIKFSFDVRVTKVKQNYNDSKDKHFRRRSCNKNPWKCSISYFKSMY